MKRTAQDAGLSAEDQRIDRQFYTLEENTVEDGYDPFGAWSETRRGDDLWERQQLRQSGRQVQVRDEAETQQRVHLTVHDERPPFLDGTQKFSHRKDPVSAVVDPQSDLAVVARRGSRLVKERRERRERERAAAKLASSAGTALGNLTGVKQAPKQVDSLKLRKKDEPISLSSARRSLPAFAVRDELLACIRDNQVVVCIGETGSGKTTQLTQYLRESGFARDGMIACTQPRRVAAMSVARRVAEEVGCSLGDEVGYTIRFEDRTSDKTKIKYMTDGILLREALVDRDLDNYSCIIMDEAHERALNTDILMGLLKRVLRRRRDLKLIVTSATMNADRFSAFFGGAPQFRIPGRTFPVDVLYARSTGEDYVEAAVKQTLSIHLSQPKGDILVFMTGQEDIEVTCEVLKERLATLADPPELAILPIYSTMPADLQSRIFDLADCRKVIVATNIAETSLTLDGVRYVVDSGYAKLKVYNGVMQMDALQVTPIARANADQRSGRAGRTAPGVAYRLYTEGAYRREMYGSMIPEVQRTNLSNTILLLKSLGIDNLLDFDFMDPPPQDTMLSSLFDLWAIGALDDAGALTDLGRSMSAFPMEPSLSKLIITASELGCLEEVLTIVSMLSVPPVFHRPRERAEASDAAREKFCIPESDHLTLMYVYDQWRVHDDDVVWCEEHFLQSRSLRRAAEVRSQLVDICLKQGMTLSSTRDWDLVRKCIASGYFHQAARLKSMTEYVNLRSGMAAAVHPTSALCGLGALPEFVVYHQVTLTSRTFMHVATQVEPHWLADFGSVFFSIGGRRRERERVCTRERPAVRSHEAKSVVRLDDKRPPQTSRSAVVRPPVRKRR